MQKLIHDLQLMAVGVGSKPDRADMTSVTARPPVCSPGVDVRHYVGHGLSECYMFLSMN